MEYKEQQSESQRLLKDEIEPALDELLTNSNLGSLLQQEFTLEAGIIEFEFKVSQSGQQLLQARKCKYRRCPTGDHSDGGCFHNCP